MFADGPSWSKSGRLLASGSDDQHLNIHSYQPDDSTTPFRLSTTVSTGHIANIFSVKFMPHSNDRTLLTAAGDGDVRIFDLEHSGSSPVPSTRSRHRSNRVQGFLNSGVRYMSEYDAKVKVYRSHSDRVKRIVTESSPYLFLSCSEDGEVRQWDIRQPESAYPRPPGVELPGTVGDPPPALISYKRQRLDLNTISCSPSQPHYIALGGAHMHCLIHDRRMLGRDRTAERGSASSSSSGYSDHQEDLLSEATQCVKRLAPHGLRNSKGNEHGHITACKISDANPNEVIASWSGDWIYSFDILRSPDARDLPEKTPSFEKQGRNGRARNPPDRKRKRKAAGSATSVEAANRASSKPRRSQESPDRSMDASLRVRYENGQVEDVPLLDEQDATRSRTELADPMSLDDLTSYRISTTSVKIRKEMFTLSDAQDVTEQDPTGHCSSFTSVLGYCASILDDTDHTMRTWRYPVNPEPVDTVLQTNLRENREKSRRFVQASGTLARVLGGKLRTASVAQKDMSAPFIQIVPAPAESGMSDLSEQFSYDFLKAICLWLDSGPGAVVEGFSRKPNQSRTKYRHPIADESSIDAIDGVLIPYLLRLASTRPIPNVDASRFEIETNLKVFDTEVAAVRAFSQAIRMPFADLSSVAATTQTVENGGFGGTTFDVQSRQAALRFWGLKVARGVLLNAGKGVNYAFVDRAFGGMGMTNRQTRTQEDEFERRLEHIDPTESEYGINSIVITRDRSEAAGEDANEASDEEMVPLEDVRDAMNGLGGEDDDDIGDAEDEHDDQGDDEDEDGDEQNAAEDELFFNPTLRRRGRKKVNTHVPCIGADRCYMGAANVRTVKDVNFFGLQDEYVVSGSDDGNFFIWDRHTTKRLNILEGDGEVVNVVQGHPYEPMLAVSGIDHTIKIFSPDKRARQAARKGEGVTAVDDSGFSSLRLGGRSRFAPGPQRPAQRRTEEGEARWRKEAEEPQVQVDNPATTSEPAFLEDEGDDTDDEDTRIAPHGLSSRRRIHNEYEIASQNDQTRTEGNNEAFISRGMLMALMRRMGIGMPRRRPPEGADGGGNEGGNEDGEGEDGTGGEVVVVDPDQCSVSVARSLRLVENRMRRLTLYRGRFSSFLRAATWLGK